MYILTLTKHSTMCPNPLSQIRASQFTSQWSLPSLSWLKLLTTWTIVRKYWYFEKLYDRKCSKTWTWSERRCVSVRKILWYFFTNLIENIVSGRVESFDWKNARRVGHGKGKILGPASGSQAIDRKYVGNVGKVTPSIQKRVGEIEGKMYCSVRRIDSVGQNVKIPQLNSLNDTIEVYILCIKIKHFDIYTVAKSLKEEPKRQNQCPFLTFVKSAK